MATTKQRNAAKKNIKKAQSRWKGMSHTEHARSQPEGRGRKTPGSTGEGRYYHIEVRPKSGFVTFRTQDVGDKGHIQRVAGKRSSGSWSTVKWLVSKDDAHLQNGRLVADTKEARDLLTKLSAKPVHKSGDRFEAKDRPNVPERAKPTAAQKRARTKNIRKAQAARNAK